MRFKLKTPFVVASNASDRRYDVLSHPVYAHLTIPAGTVFDRNVDLFSSTCGTWTVREPTAEFMLRSRAATGFAGFSVCFVDEKDYAMGRKGKTGRGAGGHHKMENFGNGVVRRPIAMLNAAKELEAITGVEAINTRQASTIQEAISGVRCDVMSFRHQYETAERLLPRLIRKLEELETPNQ